MSGLRVVVSGMVAADPWQGGASWAVLQYVAGLRRLGHQVVFVEPVGGRRLRPPGASLEGSENAAYFRELPFVGRDDRSALLLDGDTATVGPSYERLRSLIEGADLLLNISGLLRDERLLESVGTRAYVDLDPGFTQAWTEAGHDLGLDRHDRHLTVGLRLGAPECLAPTVGRKWVTTLPPVALEHWPAVAERGDRGFTSVGHWRSYGSLVHDGVDYGQRAHSVRELLELPARAEVPVRLALGIHPDEAADLRALAAHRWELADPVEVAGTPERYREFIRSSSAELGIAKLGYVRSRSGWFSDRTACYLASGRPAVCQDTGFSRALETGTGLLSFDSVDGAVEAIRAVEADWGRHSRAAREWARAHLDSDRVLARILELCAAR